MATSNGRPNFSPSQPKNARARMRCAELETGRNSVRPWTTPRSAACMDVGTAIAVRLAAGRKQKHRLRGYDARAFRDDALRGGSFRGGSFRGGCCATAGAGAWAAALAGPFPLHKVTIAAAMKIVE